jgi:hypothetical protein
MTDTQDLKSLTTNLRGRRNKQLIELRRREARERQAERDNRTPQEQLARLDRILGNGQGARRERARLKKQIQELTRKSNERDRIEKRRGNA